VVIWVTSGLGSFLFCVRVLEDTTYATPSLRSYSSFRISACMWLYITDCTLAYSTFDLALPASLEALYQYGSCPTDT
jgi:hypothetical protein